MVGDCQKKWHFILVWKQNKCCELTSLYIFKWCVQIYVCNHISKVLNYVCILRDLFSYRFYINNCVTCSRLKIQFCPSGHKTVKNSFFINLDILKNIKDYVLGPETQYREPKKYIIKGQHLILQNTKHSFKVIPNMD